MTGQMNLLEDLERKERDDKIYLDKQARYEKWLTLPDTTPIADGSPERAELNETLYNGTCNLYMGAYHVCETMPDTHYIWMNAIEREYWVLNERGTPGGEHVEVCPYCGAELSQGRGDAILEKAAAKYWLFFLHYDTPMRELGYQPEADRAAIKAVWG